MKGWVELQAGTRVFIKADDIVAVAYKWKGRFRTEIMTSSQIEFLVEEKAEEVLQKIAEALK